jgi:hypothetical protein
VETPLDQQSHPLADALHLLQVVWSNLALIVAFGAGMVALVAAGGAPSNLTGPLGDGPTGLAPTLYELACLALPFMGLGGVTLSRLKRTQGQLLVAVGGFGTCATAAAAVALAGPDQRSFLPLGEGAGTHGVAEGAIIATVAALVMVVASAIDTR